VKVNGAALVRILMALDLLGPPGDKVCSSDPGTGVYIFPGVTEKEAFLIQSAGRHETKGLGQWEETCTRGPGLGLLSKT